MSATNSTPIINLPLFIGTDKPAWLTDWNGAMNIIDTAIANLQTAESGTATSLASLAQSVEALSGTVSQHTTAIQTVTQATAGNTGSINTINSLIGNGTPTTTDKTIIGAINEINAKIPEGGTVEAEDVTYDNTTSGLTATDVQAAIDEVNAKIPQGGAVEADDVVYDNTQSGLTATDVQAAIDELAQSGSGTKSLIATSSGSTYAAQLTSLQTAFNALTPEQKQEAYLADDTGSSIYIYQVFNGGAGLFGYISFGTGLTGEFANISNATYYNVTSGANTDQSQNTHATQFKLYA